VYLPRGQYFLHGPIILRCMVGGIEASYGGGGVGSCPLVRSCAFTYTYASNLLSNLLSNSLPSLSYSSTAPLSTSQPGHCPTGRVA
jgi:hypothetical protein